MVLNCGEQRVENNYVGGDGDTYVFWLIKTNSNTSE